MRLYFHSLVVVVAVFVFGFLMARAHDYEQARLDQANLELRVQQLEIHDCGLRQYEDYSVATQRNDDIRARCVNLVTAPS